MTACPNCGFDNAKSAKFCSECGGPLVSTIPTPREIRRTVTVLFADVTGSTALGERLDPESLRTLMARYFSAIRQIIERHGGLVEKFIGDAVMAVFGIPVLHEDDGLRAVRAAADIRDTLADLNQELQRTRGLSIVFRTGVNTGEVAAGEGSAGPTLVTGDAVNTAARLEQAAAPGEILLGQSTYRLVRDAVVAEPTEPIEAKGKAQPVPAYRLLSVIPRAAGRSRRLDAPMVGREREVRTLSDGLERAVVDRGAQLVTVVGAAGVGKSRLIEEFQQRNQGRATFLIGRCLSYGEGITYWPLADALRGAVAVDDDKPAESWRAGLTAVLEDETQAEGIVEQVVGLIGVGEATGGTEAFWAVRRLLEAMARGHPLVLVIEDVHWATPTFLDLVDHVADWTRDAPILLVCLARPELLDTRPGWGGGKRNATTFLIEPLDASSIDSVLAQLVGSTIAAGLGRRIAAAAEGNPLFVEELVGMLIESGALVPESDGMRLVAEPAALMVPPTIEALVAARLAQLPFGDRATLERGSVIGTQFGAGELANLSDDAEPAAVRAVLVSMVRRDFLRPDAEAQLPLGGDDAFRFRHQVIRDGAYAGMSKAERAQLHERYANLLAELPAEQVGALAEVTGYHLEQAALLWNALGGIPPGATDPGPRAASHLGAAGRRALGRLDISAAANLLGRAFHLLPPADPQRIELLPSLANSLIGVGQFDRAEAVLDEAIQATNTGSNPDVRVRALLERSRLAGLKGASASEQQPDIDEAFEIAEASGDLRQLARVRDGRADLAANAGRLADAVRELEQAVDAAKRAGDRNLEASSRTNLTWVTWWATSSASDIDRTLTESLAFSRDHGMRSMQNGLLRVKAVEAARRGNFPEARRVMAEWFEILDDLGTMHTAGAAMERGSIESLAGDPVAREEVLRESYEQLRAIGERGVLSTVAADLADALIDLDRLDEAEALCAVAEEAGAEDDIATQVRVRLAHGRVAAASGNMDKALVWAAEAMALADEGEFYDTRTASRLVLARLLLDAGHMGEARTRAQEVVDLAQVRGDVIFKARAERLIEGATEL